MDTLSIAINTSIVSVCWKLTNQCKYLFGLEQIMNEYVEMQFYSTLMRLFIQYLTRLSCLPQVEVHELSKKVSKMTNI